MGDALGQARRELPWKKFDQQYIFDAPNGKQALAELFDGRNQLDRCAQFHYTRRPDFCRSEHARE